MTRRARRALSFASGVVLALAGPPTSLVPALFVGMAGIAFALEDADGKAAAQPPLADGATRFAKRRAQVRAFCTGGMRGWLFGLGANLVAFRFVPSVITRFTPLPMAVALLALVLLAAAQGLRWFFAAVVAKKLAARGVPTWLAFGVGTYAGSFFPMVFPWSPGAGASAWPRFVQSADIFGERGVTAWMAIAAALGAAALHARKENARRAMKLGGAAVAIPLIAAAHGTLRMKQVDAARSAAKSAKVALVEPAIPATMRWDPSRAHDILDTLSELTRRAEAQGATLTIWPESAYPFVMSHGARHDVYGPQAILQHGVHGPVLTGVLLAMQTPHGRDEFNSALVVAKDGSLSAPYDKMHLLWFGEQVPLADVFPALRHAFSRALGLAPGDHQVLLVAGDVRAAVLNCFEDTLPEAGREAMDVSPNLLVNVTNDAWFADPASGAPEAPNADAPFSLEGELHLRMAVMRAVEARRDLVRAVNLGPTTFVDATGRVRGRYASHTPGFLEATPALLDGGPTLFSRLGDAPWAALLALISAALVRTNGRANGTKSKSARP